MNYLIPESKLFGFIYKFIDKEIKEEGLVVYNGFDYDAQEYTDLIKWFYFEKNDGDVVFMEYVTKEWYERPDVLGFVKSKWMDSAPILEFRGDDVDFINKMEGFFGDFWKKPFKQWFRDNYPEYPVKTFLF